MSTSHFVETVHPEEQNVGAHLGAVLEMLAAEAVLAEAVEESEVGVVPNANLLPVKNSTRSSIRTSKLVKLLPNANSRKFVDIYKNETAFALKMDNKQLKLSEKDTPKKNKDDFFPFSKATRNLFSLCLQIVCF